MTLPQATSIQIQSRDPSPAEMRAYAASRSNKWFSPPARPVKRAEPVEAVVTRICLPTRSAPVVKLMQHDAHVRAWRAHLRLRAELPMDFVKRRCEDFGVRFHDIIGPSRKRHLIEPRHRIMADVKEQYPLLSLPHIGRMFNRDHSVIYFALKKFGIRYEPVTLKSRASEVRILFDEGKTGAEIGKVFGFTKEGVNTFIRRMGWTR